MFTTRLSATLYAQPLELQDYTRTFFGLFFEADSQNDEDFDKLLQRSDVEEMKMWRLEENTEVKNVMEQEPGSPVSTGSNRTQRTMPLPQPGV